MNIFRLKMKEIALILLFLLAASSIAAAYLSGAQRGDEYYKQGYLYYQESDFKAAIAEYDKALAQSPNMSKAYYWKAKCFFMLKEYDGVVVSYAGFQ